LLTAPFTIFHIFIHRPFFNVNVMYCVLFVSAFVIIELVFVFNRCQPNCINIFHFFQRTESVKVSMNLQVREIDLMIRKFLLETLRPIKMCLPFASCSNYSLFYMKIFKHLYLCTNMYIITINMWKNHTQGQCIMYFGLIEAIMFGLHLAI